MLMAKATGPSWTAEQVREATCGSWIMGPPSPWSASGLCIHPPTMRPGHLVAVRSAREGSRGIAPLQLARLSAPPAGVITSEPANVRLVGVPVLQVADTGEAILAMGDYARRQMAGKVLAVTGSAGKTTTVAMLAHALEPWGEVERSAHNANLPHGVAWNLASMSWGAPHIVLEIAVGRMGWSARMARPDVAIFTNILPAHLGERSSLRDIAVTKSAIFSGMDAGACAILNRDMQQWDVVHEAALARRLRILHYGTSADSDSRLIGYSAEDRCVTALIEGKPVRYRVGAPGVHMALNSLAVIAAVSALGLPIEPALERLERFTALAGRGAAFRMTLDGKRFTVIDDAYNANPGSMAAALDHLGRRSESGRKIAILGEMAELGPTGGAYHSELAPAIERSGIDKVYVMGTLYAEFWEQIPEERRGRYVGTLDELKTSLHELQDNDVVLFKGSHSTGVHKLVAWIRERMQ